MSLGPNLGNTDSASQYDALIDKTVPIFVAAAQPSKENKTLARPACAHVWGADFARVNMRETLLLAADIIERRTPEYFITANVNYLMLTERHPRLCQVNQDSIAVIADGLPIVMRSRWGSYPLPERVAGSDLIVELSKQAEEMGHRVFFLGGAEGVAQRAANELVRRFPGLQVAGCEAPPFRPLSQAEHEEMIGRIKATNPDILFVAFGQPKGEFWIHDHLQELEVPLSIQLGASFDFLAGAAKRAPKIWQRLGCEWLYRACSDPRRLIPRYAANSLFLLRRMLLDLVQ